MYSEVLYVGRNRHLLFKCHSTRFSKIRAYSYNIKYREATTPL